MTKSPHAQGRRYGFKPDSRPDRHLYCAAPVPQSFPAKFSLRAGFGPVYDQGQTSSCTGNATAGALQYLRKKEGKTPDFVPSRLYVYYNGRNAEGMTGLDCGAAIEDVVDQLAETGFCSEDTWPFDAGKVCAKPADEAYAEGKIHLAPARAKIFGYEEALKATLFAGNPVILGISVYDGLESAQAARSGRVHVPGASERFLGGHAIVLVGWDDAKGWEMRNSWGSAWGDQGYFWLDKAYLLNPQWASSFTVLQNA